MAPALQDPIPNEAEQRHTVIVLLGRFNPAIFQPWWFASHELLDEMDVETQSVVVADQVSSFQARDFGLMCTMDRCQFATTAVTPTPDILRDLVTETFSILKETPISQIGLNHGAHIPPSVRAWNTIATQLGEPQRSFPVLGREQKLQTIEFTHQRDDTYTGARRLTLQPSEPLTGGVWFMLNDYVDLSGPVGQLQKADAAMSVLEEIWMSSKDLAQYVLEEVAPRQ